MFIFWFCVSLLSCCNVIFVVDELGRLVDDEVFVGECFLYGLKLILFELVLMSEVYWFMKIWLLFFLVFNILEGDFVFLK